MTKLFSQVLLILNLSLSSFIGINNQKINKVNQTISTYYFQHLISEDSRNIYRALHQMMKQDKFKSGNYTIDLIKEGFLENREYNQNRLMSDFIAARDSFRFDNPQLFYVDFSKLTIRQLQNGSNYKINIGIGRDSNYFYDGYNENNIDKIINDVESKITSIIDKTENENIIIDKLNIVYEEIIKSSSYALETTAKLENKLYVRSPYGTLVKGEALCEGFATATKMVLDKMGYESVLVQGMYNYNDQSELHMWNYIKMDDSRWYLLDPTMENGLNENGETRNYFIKSGNDEIISDYSPNGSISLTSSTTSFELEYPNLSGVNYVSNNNHFTFEKEKDMTFASYLGMGIGELEKKGKYLVYTYDVDTMKTGWTYYAQSYAAMQVMASSTPKIEDIDFGNKTNVTFLGDYKYILAITNVKPDYSFNKIADEKLFAPEVYSYNGSLEELYDYSNIKGDVSLSKSKPYVISKTPSGISLEENKEYEVSITYSENLIKQYLNEPIEIKGYSLLGDVTTSKIKWDENNSDTITFSFKTNSSYHKTLNYYFLIDNLIGKNSKEAPLEACFSVINNTEFACPQVEGAITTVYTNKPALISDGDLSTSDWVDKDGNKVQDNLPFKLALVASKTTKEKDEQIIEKIEQDGTKVLQSSTFELNLQLCGAQIAYLNGNKLKVLMPFPDGYGPENYDVSFKAYHFKKDGTPELIESIVTEHGIIMIVDSFSPFAIIATNEIKEYKDLIIQHNGKSYTTEEIIKLNKGESKKIKIKIDKDYGLDYISLNNKNLIVNQDTVEISYDDLKSYGNLLEINTILKDVLLNEQKEGYHSIGNGSTNNNLEDKNSNLIGIIIAVISISLIVVLLLSLIFLKKHKKII